MASNSSAAFFGIRDGDQQDQIKPLISPQQHQQQLAAALPGVADAAAAAPGHGAPRRHRHRPRRRELYQASPFPTLRSCMHRGDISVAGSRLNRLEFYGLVAGNQSIFFHKRLVSRSPSLSILLRLSCYVSMVLNLNYRYSLLQKRIAYFLKQICIDHSRLFFVGN